MGVSQIKEFRAAILHCVYLRMELSEVCDNMKEFIAGWLLPDYTQNVDIY